MVEGLRSSAYRYLVCTATIKSTVTLRPQKHVLSAFWIAVQEAAFVRGL